jgi:hypothetical protein
MKQLYWPLGVFVIILGFGWSLEGFRGAGFPTLSFEIAVLAAIPVAFKKASSARQIFLKPLLSVFLSSIGASVASWVLLFLFVAIKGGGEMGMGLIALPIYAIWYVLVACAVSLIISSVVYLYTLTHHKN